MCTNRLELQVLASAHEEALQRCASDRAIADTMISVPHPFTKGHAREWIRRAGDGIVSGDAFHWGVFMRADQSFTGYVTIRDRDRTHNQAELSFWICAHAWGNGYAREACAKVLEFAFNTLQINRVYAHYMVRNPASGRVLQHLGFRREGLLRQRVIKWGRYEDVILAAILKNEWQ